MENYYSSSAITRKNENEVAYFMNKLEAAEFISRHESKLVNHPILRGRYAERFDAVSQVKIKVLGAKIENGQLLGFTKDQLATPRTTSEWLTFFAGHARARLGILVNQATAWYHPDIQHPGASDDPEDDLSSSEAAFVRGIDGDAPMAKRGPAPEAPETERKPEAEHGPETDATDTAEVPSAWDVPRKPDAYTKWRKEQRRKLLRILGYIEYEKDRHARNCRSDFDRERLRGEVREEVLKILQDARFSDRDIKGYFLAVFGEYRAKEILAMMPEFKSVTNIDRAKCVMNKAVRDAALRPGSRLAFLYAA